MKRHQLNPNHRIPACVFVGLLLAIAGHSPLHAEENEETGTLWPGESHAFLGITITWQIPEGGIPITPVPSPAPATETPQGRSEPGNERPVSPHGWLQFKGPETELRDVAAPFGISSVRMPSSGELVRKYYGSDVIAYIDDVALILKGKARPGISYSVDVRASRELSHRNIGGPAVDGLTCFVSSVCPLHLNEWTLTVSDHPIPFPDGSRSLELRAVNTNTKEETSFPLLGGAARKIGRFQVSVKNAWEAAKTAMLRVDAEADPAVPGRLAAVPEKKLVVQPGETLETFLSGLAKHYRFEVQWIPYPNHPESVAYLKGLQGKKPFHIGVFGTLGDALEKLFTGWPERNDVGALHWTDDTHLQILSDNYDKYITAQEKKKKQEAEEVAAKAKRQAELEKFKKIFADQYSLRTKIYTLDTLTPITAKALVDPELRKYSLLQFPVRFAGKLLNITLAGRDYERNVAGTVHFAALETGEYHLIVSLAPDVMLESPSLDEVIEDVVEEAIPDDKANALIVTAIPATQEKVAAILYKMQQLAEAKGETGPPPTPYRISAVLLRGVQSEQQGETALARVSGTVKEIPVKVGEIVGPGAVIVRLDPATVTDSEIELYTQGRKDASDPEQKLSYERKIQEVRERIARSRDNEAILQGGPMRVVSIDVKPGDKVIAGQQVATSKRVVGKSASALSPAALKEYGLGPDDLKAFDIANVVPLGRGIVSLVPEKGEAGVARIALSDHYHLTLTFLDERKPYLVVKGTLQSGEESGGVVLENALYLEPGKPSLLGVTNLREALILVVQRLEDSGDAAEAAPAAEPDPK